MKTVICLSLFLFSSNIRSLGQKISSHEIQIGYGPFAREHVLLDAIDNFGRSIIREPNKQIIFSKTYSVTYRYQANKRMAVSINAGFASGASRKKYLFESINNYTHNSYMVTFEAKFNYLIKPNLRLYYFGGAGGFLMREKNLSRTSDPYKTYAYHTFQVSPIGVRLGKKIGIFAEIGYGYKGIINMGISAKF